MDTRRVPIEMLHHLCSFGMGRHDHGVGLRDDRLLGEQSMVGLGYVAGRQHSILDLTEGVKGVHMPRASPLDQGACGRGRLPVVRMHDVVSRQR